MHSLTEKLKFFRAFLRSPRQIGSVIPTSSVVIGYLMDRIEWNRADLVVEYGPGLGTITRPMLARLRPDARMIVIDMNPDFVAHLRRTINDPRLMAVHGSAADVEAILMSQAGGSRADYVVSGLPFSTLPEGVGAAIMRATRAALRDDGAFLIYQYSRLVLPLLRPCFGEIEEGMIWRNIPPCRIFTARPGVTPGSSGAE